MVLHDTLIICENSIEASVRGMVPNTRESEGRGALESNGKVLSEKKERGRIG